MDKYEYKVRADEIKSLIAEGDYEEAVKIADTIDWRRVKSVMMLCTVSDLYKINRRYEDSRDILLLAYEKQRGRLIVYSLCELSIKLGEYVQAIEYYKEFVQLAPKDSGRYVLQYKLYEAQDVSLEERIEVLEELKRHDYREKWAYELAYLYHRVGLESKCIEECDEMILWFGEGRYVLKAYELKMLHTSLTPEQQENYEHLKNTGSMRKPEIVDEQENVQHEAQGETEEEGDDEYSRQMNQLTDDTKEMKQSVPEPEETAVEELDIQVKPVDVSQYNTINLQKELAESMREFLENNKTQELPVLHQDTDEMKMITEEDLQEEQPQESPKEQPEEKQQEAPKEQTGEQQEPEPVKEKTQPGEDSGEEVFFGNTSEVNIQDVVTELTEKNAEKTAFRPMEEEQPQKKENLSNTGVIRTFHKKSGYDDMLSQEYDGQISLVVPEEEQVEKQITGQLSIQDVMAEWEKMKKENEKKRLEEIRNRVRKQTDNLFADFDESTKSGLLEELEKAMVTAAIKDEKRRAEQMRPKVVKVSDIEKSREEEKDSIIEQPEEIMEEPVEEQIEEPVEEIIDEPIEEAETSEEPEVINEIEESEEVTEETGIPEVDEESEDASADAEETEEVDEEADASDREENSGNAEEPEDTGEIRELTDGEREQFAPFIHHKKTRRQIAHVIDHISLASYTGNVIVTGEEGTETTAFAKLLIKEVQATDNNFSGKVAKISGSVLNKKDIPDTLNKLSNGALIVEGACALKKPALDILLKELNQEEKGLILILEDTKQRMESYLNKNAEIRSIFDLRVDLEALDDQTLVKYAKKYAFDQEYAIDELGTLALHTRIADMQTSDHEVTLSEIEELVDEAIYYANKKTPKHFFDVLFGNRYDDEDMIILRERDFMHY